MDVSLIKKKEGKKELCLSVLVEAAAVSLAVNGFLTAVLNLLEVSCNRGWLLGFSFVAAMAAKLLSMGKYGSYGGIGALVLWAGVGVSPAGKVFLDGAISLYNQIAYRLSCETKLDLQELDRIYPQDTGRNQLLFLFFLAAFLGVVCFLLIKIHWEAGLAFFWILAEGISLYLKKNWDTLSMVSLLAGLSLIWLLAVYQGKKRGIAGNSSGMVLISGLVTGIGVILLTLGMKYLLPDTLPLSKLGNTASEKIAEAAEEFRYGGKEINRLPKGELSGLGSWEASEDTALTVTMDTPESLYLRGYVGSSYNGSGWETLDGEITWEQRPLFYWLHQSGFYGNRQLNLAAQEAGEQTEQNKITVKNENADREYYYLPYELSSFTEETLSKEDAGQSSRKFRGEREYEFETAQNLTGEFPDLAAKLYLAQDGQGSYLEEEPYYNAFVYENYLELPDSTRKLLKEELGNNGSSSMGHVNYYWAISRIQTYLESAVNYTETTGSVPDSGDFLSYFLKEAKGGYSVQYATAAALMFRYYGIPSRYVEGYLITPEDIEGKQAGEEISIPGTNGEAWVEIYVDTLGWVPLEMVPEEHRRMEQPDLTRGLQADSTKVVSPQQQQSQNQVQQTGNTENSIKEAFLYLGKILLAILLIFDCFCLVFFLYVICRRLITIRRRKKLFYQPDVRKGICCVSSYMITLLEYLSPGLGNSKVKESSQWVKEHFTDDLAREYTQARTIAQRAAFSTHEMTQADRAEVLDCQRQMLKEILKRKSWQERWRMRYICRLY
ncbi:hypothetical protein B5F53_02430 [Blautia sp. An249]|uniref:transglutaminase-like domain-containing protein n=1 Tax=Blautia sp. An249 TaxID=1965603 RepID=UPI000B37C2E8|nr:transglutaminase-like domain-containing protein [Blautia sp. An249]OUO80594.1 hypothetical protein B5F53_02430 [Blautia sp. An249]